MQIQAAAPGSCETWKSFTNTAAVMSDVNSSIPPRPWILKVGDLYCSTCTVWDDNRFEYRYFSGNHLLQLCARAPSADEIKAFKHGTINFGLHIHAAAFFVIFKIEGFYDWSDQAFTIHRVAVKDRVVPDYEPGTRQPLNLVLVEAETGIVAGLRVVTFSPHLSSTMHRLLREQLAAPFSDSDHAAMIDATYRRYPTSEDLVLAADVMERPGLL